MKSGVRKSTIQYLLNDLMCNASIEILSLTKFLADSTFIFIIFNFFNFLIAKKLCTFLA